MPARPEERQGKVPSSIFVVRLKDQVPVCQCPDLPIATAIAEALGDGFRAKTATVGESLRWVRELEQAAARVEREADHVSYQFATSLEFYTGDDEDLAVRERLSNTHGDYMDAQAYLRMLKDSADAHQQPVVPQRLSEVANTTVSKPDGWTRARLIDQANHDDGERAKTLSGTTFDRIRQAAGIPAAEKGGVGAQRRFSVVHLRKLIDAAENGTYRNRSNIAAAWRELLPF